MPFGQIPLNFLLISFVFNYLNFTEEKKKTDTESYYVIQSFFQFLCHHTRFNANYQLLQLKSCTRPHPSYDHFISLFSFVNASILRFYSSRILSLGAHVFIKFFNAATLNLRQPLAFRNAFSSLSA